MQHRRSFLKSVSAAGLTAALAPLASCSEAHSLTNKAAAAAPEAAAAVSPELAKRMYDKALGIAKTKIRGGDKEPFFKQPYLDEAFSPNIFYWDTCFMTCYAKYHQQELPIAQALDNFYRVQDADGYIGREYLENGQPFWEKHHPVSINPPLLAFAELELQSQQPNVERLRQVYPHPKSHFEFLQRAYRVDDGLYFGDTLGMDNIPRYPPGWQDDGKGLPVKNLYPKIFQCQGTNASWNIKGRLVDFSAQMAFFAQNLKRIAQLTNHAADVPAYEQAHAASKQVLNAHCWSEADGSYFELARALARRFYGVVAEVFERTGTFWENYAPEFASYGNPAKADFCGWTAIVPITIWREFI